MESPNSPPSTHNFSLAFIQPNTDEKYYVLPKEGDGNGVIPLSIHKNPSVNKYIFAARPAVPGVKDH